MRYTSIFLLLTCSILAATPAYATERVAQKTQLNPGVHHDSTGLPTHVSGISASCGGANGTVASSVPADAAACAQGSRTVTDGAGTDGSYNWTCSSGSGQTVSCSAQTDSTSNITASCGAANGTSTTTLPTGSAACSTGTQSSTDPTGSNGSFNWTCTSGSQTVACAATNSGSPSGSTVQAQCGNANGIQAYRFNGLGSSSSSPNSSWNWFGGTVPSVYQGCYQKTLCAVGYSTITDQSGTDGTFNWTCGGSGYVSVSCQATRTSSPRNCNAGPTASPDPDGYGFKGWGSVANPGPGNLCWFDQNATWADNTTTTLYDTNASDPSSVATGQLSIYCNDGRTCSGDLSNCYVQ